MKGKFEQQIIFTKIITFYQNELSGKASDIAPNGAQFSQSRAESGAEERRKTQEKHSAKVCGIQISETLQEIISEILFKFMSFC